MRQRSPSAAIAILLYAAEGAALLSVLAIYKKGVRPWAPFLSTPVGLVLIAALLLLLAALLVIIWLVRNNPERARSLSPTLVLNVCSLVLMMVGVELAFRVMATGTPAGPVIGDLALLPKSWGTVSARNLAVLERATTQQSYLVFDQELGWTIGANRRSRDYNRAFQERYLAEHDDPDAQKRLQDYRADQDIYLSSAEGMRSPRSGFSFASQPAGRRIALIGDSFTFGLEVAYEQTWGQQLERSLGSQFRVLNFGVDGYGVDQAYLKYLRDVAPWHPEVVILSIISDDLRRTMCVYGFLCFPWSEIPFAKPRFAFKGDTLALLNQPLLAPDSVFARKSIEDLPFVDHDPAFDAAQWQSHFYYHSFAVRFVLSRFPRWPIPPAVVSDDALLRVNTALIRAFVRAAEKNGSSPVVVFFPSRTEFSQAGGSVTRGIQVLRASGVPFIDATSCVTDVPAAERFVVLHYSPATNARIARCLQDPVMRLLGKVPSVALP